MAFGDSITFGALSAFNPNVFIAAANGGYPERLQVLLNAAHAPQQFQVVNRGLGAEAVASALSRFRSALTSVRPEAVLLLEGVNDLSFDADPIRVAASLFALVDTATANGIPVVVSTMFPTYASSNNPLGEERHNGAALVPIFNAEVRRLAVGRLNVHLVDLEPLMQNRSLVGGDGLHPTEAGYQIMATAFQQRVEAAFPVRGSFQ